MVRFFALLLTLGMVYGLTVPAQAGLMQVYTDRAVFLSDTGATNAVGGPLPNLGLIPGGGGASQTLGSVTFTLGPGSSQLYIGTGNASDWTVRTPGLHDIAISGLEHLNLALSAPVFAAGFDFVEPNDAESYVSPAETVDSTFTVTLKSGAATVGQFNFNAPDNVLAFAGVWTDTAFDRLEVREVVGTHDDEFYGEVFTSAARPLPLPGAVWLLGSGLVGLGFLRRRLLP